MSYQPPKAPSLGIQIPCLVEPLEWRSLLASHPSVADVNPENRATNVSPDTFIACDVSLVGVGEVVDSASVKKAAFLIESTYRGRGLVDNERDIRKAWSKYKDISHLAASLRMMVGDEYLWGQRSLEGLSIFLAIAKDLENFGVSFYPHARDLALLDSKKVWSVPKRLPLRLPQLTGPAAPPIPDRDLAVLQDYRA